MKRLMLLLLVLTCFSLCACVSREYKQLSFLEGAFEADVEGTFRGVSFAGKLSCAAASENGVRVATFTFYAPSELAGTRVIRDETGELKLSVDDVTVQAPQTYETLLTLFSLGRVSDVVREHEGTRITGENASLLLDSNGIPLSIENGEIVARVLCFSQK